MRALQNLFDGITDIACPVTGQMVTLHLEEDDDRTIPATRLSDGTLRYLCLLALLFRAVDVANDRLELGTLLRVACDELGALQFALNH